MRIRVAIYKRKSSWDTAKGKTKKGWSWYARWRVEELVDGAVKVRDRHKSLDTQDRAMAERMRIELEDKLNAPAPEVKPLPTSLDWETAADLHWRYHLSNLSANTQLSVRHSWTRFWTWAAAGTTEWPGITLLEQVEPYHVIDFRKGVGLAPSTVNNVVINCGGVVSRLQRLRLFEGRNPFKEIEALYVPESNRDWMTAAEVQVLLKAAREISVDMYLYCALGCYAGMRAPSEILAMRWDWIQWPTSSEDTGYIRIPKSDENWRVKDKEARTIPLFPALAAILREHQGVPRAYVVAPFTISNDFRWRWCGARRAMESMADLFPGKHLTAYCMRHTFASQCVASGVELYKIMRWMGHSDIKMLSRYAHLAPADNEIRKLFAAER